MKVFFFNCSSFLSEPLILAEDYDKLTKQINKNLTRKTVTNFHGVEWDREEQGPMSCSPICDYMLTFSVFLKKIFKVFKIKRLFYNHECFPCMYVCLSYVFRVPTDLKRELEL